VVAAVTVVVSGLGALIGGADCMESTGPKTCRAPAGGGETSAPGVAATNGVGTGAAALIFGCVGAARFQGRLDEVRATGDACGGGGGGGGGATARGTRGVRRTLAAAAWRTGRCGPGATV
jgi:hypothetical protein